LVLDLTNTTRYYDPSEFTRLGVQHVKIPCRGRGRSPDPFAVNQACWEIRKALLNSPETYILIHCTHGFNRTGYMICSALCRLFAQEGIGVDRAVRRFSAARAPGIYKRGYLDDLFWQHHERRPPHILTPAVPVWKTGKQNTGGGAAGGEDARAAKNGGGGGGGDDSSDDGKSGDSDDPDAHIPLSELCGDAPPGAMHHDDVLGEAVPDEEAEYVRRLVFVAVVASRDFFVHGQPPSEAVFRQPVRFPGSQPVSLDRRNLELIQRRRYLVTWKADGTRYLLLATTWGCYLLDRAFVVRRVQVRFPTLHPPPASASARPPAHPVGPPHVFTLLDGEMVVDEEEQQAAGGSAGGGGGGSSSAGGGAQQQQPPQQLLPQQRRRYLAYDVMVLNTESVSDLRFADRIRLIEREVERPRTLERQHFAKTDAAWRRSAQAAAEAGKPPPPRPFYYAYEDEPFGVRRKDFWPITAGEKVCRDFIPRLCHESDGLILQAADDGYVPYTCEALLKWKFAHLNSVDFVLRMVEPGAGGKKEPQLLLKGRPRAAGRGGGGNASAAAAYGSAGASLPGGLTALDNARVKFPPGTSAQEYDGRVVECAWDKEQKSWVFLRERTDKGDPNAFTVFEKVVGSIEDDIREEDVLGALERAVADERGPYGEERRALEEQRRRKEREGSGGGGANVAARPAAVAAPVPSAAKAPPPPAREPTPPKAASQPPPPPQAAPTARRGPSPLPPLAAFAPPRPPTLAELAALDAAAV
jgi:mRNA-capping enzyme